MISLYASTGIGGLLRYLRGHAEATLYDTLQSPELGRDLLSRCFARSGQGFRYVADPRGADNWYNYQAALTSLGCQQDRICADCEDLSSYYAGAAAALIGEAGWVFEQVWVGIVPPPHEGAQGHAIVRVGRQISAPPAGLSLPEPGLWDVSQWHGMRTPDPSIYGAAEFLEIRRD